MAPDTFYNISMAQLAYVRCIDEGRLEEWPDFFLDNCKYIITTDRNHRQGLEGGHHMGGFARHAQRPGLVATRGQYLRAP